MITAMPYIRHMSVSISTHMSALYAAVRVPDISFQSKQENGHIGTYYPTLSKV